MPYNIPVLRELNKMGVEVLCIHNDIGKLTPYEPELIESVRYIKKSQLTEIELYRESKKFLADVVYISDRTIWEYNKVGIYYKKQGKPVISGNDTQWSKGKQWVNILTSFLRHKRYFSHMQVAGIRQFEYAKRLGFANNKIVWPMYSANAENFEKIPVDILRFQEATDILFVGRFSKDKGLEYLLEAWKLTNTKNSRLHLVGNGDLLNKLDIPLNVVIHSFSSQKYLLGLAKQCRAFVLPSLNEPWGVVLHEFAAAGLPLIATDICGASAHFIINNGNGYVVKSRSSQQLSKRIAEILTATPESLLEMGMLSRQLSKSINPKLVALAILSVVNE